MGRDARKGGGGGRRTKRRSAYKKEWLNGETPFSLPPGGVGGGVGWGAPPVKEFGRRVK